MIISFSPQRRSDTLELGRTGPHKLSINGDVLDLSDLPDGASVADAAELHPLLVAAEKTVGESRVTVILPLPERASPAQCFPADIVDPALGPVELPAPLPEPEPEEEEE